MRVFALFLLTFLVSSVSAESIKIGYIDTEMVVNNLTLYKDGKNLIASEFEQKKQELLDLFNHIELIRSSKNELDDNEIKKILELESSFKKETEFWQTTINQKQVDLLRDIEIIINNAIKELAIEDNFDLIFYENAAFVSNNVDISNKIISKIESQTP
jgi:Skp family chaperone for outer membrane proteins